MCERDLCRQDGCEPGAVEGEAGIWEREIARAKAGHSAEKGKSQMRIGLQPSCSYAASRQAVFDQLDKLTVPLHKGLHD